ncbi:hypothetical protein [uncultured Deinococcus sp.]|uniref:hypothetical protein n=1 Tax=uncultured Deinococcus sp. TaxID=158789 RepID=UPI0025F09ACA|nr:hypothetical protein [uncultured Deinococcus sp.]
MSGFSIGSFSFSRSGHRRGGFLRHSHSSGHRGGFLGHSHSSGHRGHYVQSGHYRQVRRSRGPLGCLGAFVVGMAVVGSAVGGVVRLLT